MGRDEFGGGGKWGEGKMVNDPNWLYSTIAQSSAAIVAIIGGFITATVLTISSEKRSLKRLWDIKRIQMDQLDEKFANKQDLETEKSLITIEAAEARFHLESITTPKFIWLGIAVLAYLSITGILLPVIALGYEIFNSTLRNWIIILFSLGIIGIFVYIILLIRELRRTTNVPTPRKS